MSKTTKSTGRVAKFQSRVGITPTYKCGDCGKQTRETGDGESSVELCKSCFNKATLENEHADYGHPKPVAGCPTCDAEPVATPAQDRASRMIQSKKHRTTEKLSKVKVSKKQRDADDRCDNCGGSTFHYTSCFYLQPPVVSQDQFGTRSDGKTSTLVDQLKSKKQPKPVSKTGKTLVTNAFSDWQKGAMISELADKTGVKRSKLRRLFIQLAGGKPQFKTLRAAGAGGKAEPFGGKRAVGRSNGASIDDSKVRVITSCKKSEGWKFRLDRGLHTEVHTSPDGTDYIEAKASEKADLIVSHDAKGLSPTRLRQLAGSNLVKHVKHHEKLVERGQKAHRAKRAAKRAQRRVRKGGAKS